MKTKTYPSTECDFNAFDQTLVSYALDDMAVITDRPIEKLIRLIEAKLLTGSRVAEGVIAMPRHRLSTLRAIQRSFARTEDFQEREIPLTSDEAKSIGLKPGKSSKYTMVKPAAFAAAHRKLSGAARYDVNPEHESVSIC